MNDNVKEIIKEVKAIPGMFQKLRRMEFLAAVLELAFTNNLKDRFDKEDRTIALLHIAKENVDNELNACFLYLDAKMRGKYADFNVTTVEQDALR